jgi:hypothetical protein
VSEQHGRGLRLWYLGGRLGRCHWSAERKIQYRSKVFETRRSHLSQEQLPEAATVRDDVHIDPLQRRQQLVKANSIRPCAIDQQLPLMGSDENPTTPQTSLCSQNGTCRGFSSLAGRGGSDFCVFARATTTRIWPWRRSRGRMSSTCGSRHARLRLRCVPGELVRIGRLKVTHLVHLQAEFSNKNHSESIQTELNQYFSISWCMYDPVTWIFYPSF